MYTSVRREAGLQCLMGWGVDEGDPLRSIIPSPSPLTPRTLTPHLHQQELVVLKCRVDLRLLLLRTADLVLQRRAPCAVRRAPCAVCRVVRRARVVVVEGLAGSVGPERGWVAMAR